MNSICKTVFLLLLIVVSSSALADWVKVEESNTFTAYADPTTIRTNGNVVEIWTLQDYKAVQVDPTLGAYLSARAQAEFDCKEEKVRDLRLSWYSDKMAEGAVVFLDEDPSNWNPVIPGTGDEALWKFVCKKR